MFMKCPLLLIFFLISQILHNRVIHQRQLLVMSKLLVSLKDATFKNIHSSKAATLIFQNPVSLEIKSTEQWAILGPAKSDLLKAISSQYINDPPLSRTYPFLEKSVWPSSAIQFLEFKGVLPTAHLAARYEFFKDEFDETTEKFVIGNTNNDRKINYLLVNEIFKKLKLDGLEDRWAMGLSNGQTRRARLARGLIREPKLLILDDPFLGLDPEATKVVNEALQSLPPNPYVILGLRYQDDIPDWITHLAIVDSSGITDAGTRAKLQPKVDELRQRYHETPQFNINKIKEVFSEIPAPTTSHLLEFKDVSIAYRGQPVLENLSWKVGHGTRWHVRGNNGTGKSTLLSLITAEHPQSWNESIVMYDKPRRTGSSNFFDINETIGFASPELHAIYPSNHTLYETISTGYVVGSLVPPRDLSKELADRIEVYLSEFDLGHKRNVKFGELGISDQKLALFIRSLIKNPDLLILDEALSAMDDNRIEQCKEVLRHFPGTVLAVGHLDSEVPEYDHHIKLIAPGEYEIGKK